MDPCLVNLIAFPTRFDKALRKARRFPRSGPDTAGSHARVRVVWLAAARDCDCSKIIRATSTGKNDRKTSGTSATSCRASSRTSSICSSAEPAQSRATLRRTRLFSSPRSCSNSSSAVRMPCSGVRISWLMTERKRAFAAELLSASNRPSRSARSASTRAVISRRNPIKIGAPLLSTSEITAISTVCCKPSSRRSFRLTRPRFAERARLAAIWRPVKWRFSRVSEPAVSRSSISKPSTSAKGKPNICSAAEL